MLNCLRKTVHIGLTAFLLSLCTVSAQAQSSGCEKDTDCKGERICQANQCVDPSPTTQKIETKQATSGMVMVHIESNKPDAVLAQVSSNASAIATGPGGIATASATGYSIICTVPCDTSAAPNQLYVMQKVAGFGGNSKQFSLPSADRVTIQVDSGSQLGYVLGASGGILGGGTLLSGVLVLVVGAVSNSDDDGFINLVKVGTILTVISAPVTIAGTIAALRNRTRVTVK